MTTQDNNTQARPQEQRSKREAQYLFNRFLTGREAAVHQGGHVSAKVMVALYDNLYQQGTRHIDRGDKPLITI